MEFPTPYQLAWRERMAPPPSASLPPSSAEAAAAAAGERACLGARLARAVESTAAAAEAPGARVKRA